RWAGLASRPARRQRRSLGRRSSRRSALRVLESLLEREIGAVGVGAVLRPSPFGEARVQDPAGDLRRIALIEPGKLGELVEIDRIVLLLHLDVEEEVLHQLLRSQRPAAALERHQQAGAREDALDAQRLVTGQSYAPHERLG